MKIWKALWQLFVGLWALFVFLASNGPSDVQARGEGWLNSSLLNAIPVALLEFASSRIVIATTALAVGGIIGWKLHKHSITSKGRSWHSKLATDMALLAFHIEQAGWRIDAVERLNAELMLVSLGAQKNGLAFPSQAKGFKTLNDFLPYLHRVSALLGSGEMNEARRAARVFAEKPPELPQAVF